jgi:hypothetical protein
MSICACYLVLRSARNNINNSLETKLELNATVVPSIYQHDVHMESAFHAVFMVRVRHELKAD